MSDRGGDVGVFVLEIVLLFLNLPISGSLPRTRAKSVATLGFSAMMSVLDMRLEAFVRFFVEFLGDVAIVIRSRPKPRFQSVFLLLFN